MGSQSVQQLHVSLIQSKGLARTAKGRGTWLILSLGVAEIEEGWKTRRQVGGTDPPEELSSASTAANRLTASLTASSASPCALRT